MKFDHNKISIRTITSADKDAVISLYKNGWIETYPNKTYGISKVAVQEAVANFCTTTIHKNKFVAELNGEVVGVISVKTGTPHIIQSLYVAQANQNQGVGTALLEFVIKKFGTGMFTLQVAVYNTQAIAFYKKFGFEIIANSLGLATFHTLQIPQITMRKAANLETIS